METDRPTLSELAVEMTQDPDKGEKFLARIAPDRDTAPQVAAFNSSI